MNPTNCYRNSLKSALIGIFALTMGGCAGVAVEPPHDSLARERLAFDQCHDAAMQKSLQAVTGATAALYHAAAFAMDECLVEVEESFEISHSEQAMRASALVVMNYVKAGEVEPASRQLATFRDAYPRQDLYFADGTSFVDSLRLLLGELPPGAAERGSLINAPAALKSEIRRTHYWQSH